MTRFESGVTSVSWIPSAAVTGPANKAVFDSGVAHYDEPLPDHLDDLARWQAEDRFRFANDLVAFIEVEDGKIVDHGYCGHCRMGATTMRLGKKAITLQAAAMPEIRHDPVVDETSVRFVQTWGGRTAFPAPRRVDHPPFVQFRSPLVWTTLALTLFADGTDKWEMVGASTFPRHWVYDDEGELVAKAGLADFSEWFRHSFGKHTPWGDEESPALVTAVESALERELATRIMRGGEKPTLRRIKIDQLLTEQGAPGDEIYLLLDGVLGVEVDGERIAEVGPGAILGERAVLEGGARTSTMRALTACHVAVAGADQIDREALAEVSRGHHREDVVNGG